MSLNLLREKLQQAAYEYVQAHTQEMLQEPLDGVGCPPELKLPLDQLLKDSLYEGALEALMSAQVVRGNQSKAANLLGIDRATLRTRLLHAGLLVQRRKRSDTEQAAYEARGNKSCEATRQAKVAA